MNSTISPDLTTYTNAAGGKQSVIPWKMSLWPDNLLREALKFRDEDFLEFKTALAARDLDALRYFAEETRAGGARIDCSTLTLIDETLQFGASKYGRFNWHKIPSHEHLDHALLHLYNLGGSSTDPREELAHFLTRMTFYWDMLDIEATGLVTERPNFEFESTCTHQGEPLPDENAFWARPTNYP